MKLYYVPFLVLPLALTACANTMNGDSASNYGEISEENLTTATAATEDTSYLMAAAPEYHVGQPFSIDNVQYNPVEDLTYNQTGIAGIIPSDMNGSKTKDGEIYNSDQLVAASKVLPLPTIAKVTNLENGNTVILRVNNRGPFVNTRILDVSVAAAKKLGMTSQTKVQVQVMADESTIVKNATTGTAVNTAPAPIEEAPIAQQPVMANNGPYTVQVAAFYSEDNAKTLAQRIGNMGNVQVINEGGMFKVRVLGLDEPGAKKTIETLRSTEGMAPGLLKDGKWVNANSI
jgi:rare lipoprotein A